MIDGVSSVKNAYCALVFFGDEYGNDPIYQHYVKDLQYVKFQYVRFLVKPGSDYVALAKKIDDVFHKPNVKIMQYQGQGVGKDQKVYQSPVGFVIYGIILLVFILLLQVLWLLFSKKRLLKETKVIYAYGYSAAMECIVRNGLVCIVSGIVAFLLIHPMINIVNVFAKKQCYQPFMGMNWLLLLSIIVVYSIFVCCIDWILVGRHHALR